MHYFMMTTSCISSKMPNGSTISQNLILPSLLFLRKMDFKIVGRRKGIRTCTLAAVCDGRLKVGYPGIYLEILHNKANQELANINNHLVLFFI